MIGVIYDGGIYSNSHYIALIHTRFLIHDEKCARISEITYLQICSELGENLGRELGSFGRRCKFALPAAQNPNSRTTRRGYRF